MTGLRAVLAIILTLAAGPALGADWAMRWPLVNFEDSFRQDPGTADRLRDALAALAALQVEATTGLTQAEAQRWRAVLAVSAAGRLALLADRAHDAMLLQRIESGAFRDDARESLERELAMVASTKGERAEQRRQEIKAALASL